MDGINGTLSAVLNEREKQITALARKYAVPYNDLGKKLTIAQKDFSDMVADLTGDEFALKGLQLLNK